MSDENIYDEELEELKLRKLAEMRKRIEEERERRARIEAILRQILTPEARERLYNLRLVKPELARALEEQLILLAQSGKVPIPITDEFLKKLLSELYEQTRRDTRITFKRK
ncbi:MAG: DNA-binding protein [Desulfurococcaceae archaeon]|nr:DNA-binding protein [Desulfurococcaceae archaeon]